MSNTIPFHVVLIAVLAVGPRPLILAGVPVLPSVIETDPLLPSVPAERNVPPDWKNLWVEALQAPEENLRREAALAILREHQLQAPGMENTVEPLIQALRNSKNRSVQLTIASALIELDASRAAPLLFELVNAETTTAALVVEPGLAGWNYPPAGKIWLERLAAPQSVPRQLLLLAISGVRTTKELRAVEHLKSLMMNRKEFAGIRLPAARALAELQSTGLVSAGRQLAADISPRGITDRLVAVTMLATHDSEEAQQLLLELALDEQPAVAAVALRRLLEIDPVLVQLLAPELLQNADAIVRRLAAQSLVDVPSLDFFGTLGNLLDDPHPDVRVYVRESLRDLAGQERFDAIVRRRGVDLLKIDNWHGLEQAARLMGELNHKEAAPRLVELLYFDRAEVHVTAAWSLRELAVKDVLPEMLKFAKTVSEKLPLTPGHDVCLSHLYEAFGQMRYMEPEPVLRLFVPRRYDMGPRSRGAAIWALGLLYENNAPEDLVREVSYRAADDGTIPTMEYTEVRACAAISLGRFGDKRALPALEYVFRGNPQGSWLYAASRWAIEQITGEDLPEPKPQRIAPPNPFLRSLRN